MDLYNEKTVISTAAEDEHLIRIGPTKLYNATMYNAGGATAYFQLWEGTVAAGILIQTLQIPVGATGFYDFGERGFPSLGGFTMAASANPTDFATSGNAGWFTAVYA